MNRCTLKMLTRGIRTSLGRYLAILGIVALGVGFFAGLKSSRPAMVSTADEYLRAQRFHDFRLLSTLGFTADDEAAFAELYWVAEAEGGYFADAFVSVDGGAQAVYHFMDLSERVDLPELTEGRLPENDGECLADAHAFSRGDLGKTVTLTGDNDEDALALLPGGSYIIVGLVRSPRYISTARDSTSLGSGAAEGFLLLPKGAFCAEAYHELRLWCDLPGTIYSEEYNAARDRLADPVRTELNRLGAARRETLAAEAEAELNEAQRKIDDGWDELRRGRAQAEEKLAAAEEELRAGEEEWQAGVDALRRNQEALEEGMAAIPAARAEIEANRQTLRESEEQLAALRVLYDGAADAFERGEADLNSLLSAEDAARYVALAPYYEAVVRLEAETRALRSRLDAAVSLGADAGRVAELSAQLSQRESDLAAARTELAAQEAAYVPDSPQLTYTQALVDALRERMNALGEQLSEGERQLAEGKEQLRQAEEQLDQAERDYPDNLAQINAGWDRLNEARQELDRGREELEQGREDAERELAEGEEKLLDAQRELDRGRAELAERLRLELFTLDRSANAGYVSFENDVSIVDGLADVFPLFFALVAAMVCVTTMTRMINEERTVIGTMKALGYGGGAIMAKYVLYAGSASLLGCAAGYGLGAAAIPYVVWIAYGMIYDYAKLRFYFDGVMSGASTALTVVGAALVTALACRRELAEKPAELMRPKAPKNGRRVLLEYVTPLWKRLPFLAKVSLRNAFRYPLRVLMLLLGVGGCTALMVAGFGAKDSIARISEYQYEEIFLYDISVSLDPDAFSAGIWEGQTETAAMSRQEPVTAIAGDREKSTRLVASDAGQMTGTVSLHDDAGELPWPESGQAVVTEKIADVLDLRAGDVLTLRPDEGEKLTLLVAGVCKNYVGHYVFLNIADLPDGRWNTAFLRAAPGTDPRQLGAGLRSAEGVTYVSLAAQEREMMEQSMASLDLVVLMVVACSGALAFITLYNLTNINIMERIREIATVKVLGFYPAETAAYVLRENLLLSALGALAGLFMGKGLHWVIIRAVVVDNMTYDVRIDPRSYLIALGVTLLFTVLTNAAMRPRLERVNMAESLKSVE